MSSTTSGRSRVYKASQETPYENILSFTNNAIEVIIFFEFNNFVVFNESGFRHDSARLGVLYYRAALLASWNFSHFGLRLYYGRDTGTACLEQGIHL